MIPHIECNACHAQPDADSLNLITLQLTACNTDAHTLFAGCYHGNCYPGEKYSCQQKIAWAEGTTSVRAETRGAAMFRSA